MGTIFSTKSESLDLQGKTMQEAQVAINLAAARLGVEQQSLWTDICLASIAYVQVRKIAGQVATVAVMVTGYMPHDNGNRIALGDSVMTKMKIQTPDNRNNTEVGLIIYNHTFMNAKFAVEQFYIIRREMTNEV